MESVNAPLSPTKKEPRMECEMKSPTGTAERSRRNTEVQIDLATPCGSMERSRRNTQAHVQLPERVHLDDFWSRAYFDDC